MKRKLTILSLIPLILFNCSFTNYETIGITIYSYEKSYYDQLDKYSTDYGHSFIKISNNYSWPLEVGPYTLGPFVSATLGCWGDGKTFLNPYDTYSGIYLNREAYIFNGFETMLDCYQYSFEVPRYNFKSYNVNNFINEHINHYFMVDFNCSCFVIDFLKCFTNIDLYDGILGIATPGGLKINMKKLFSNDVIESNYLDITSNGYQKYNGDSKTMIYF